MNVDAQQVRHVSGVIVSAKLGQRLDALPEAAGYLGFVFAEAPEASAVEAALRAAGDRLIVEVDPAIDVIAG